MRKILWLLAIALFIGGVTADKINPNKAKADMPSEDKVYTVSAEPLFGTNIQRFVAHRGYSNVAPENTVPAFELAGKHGFWGIETDVSESADGVFMCMHDDTIDRTTDGDGEIGAYTYSQLMEMTIDAGNNIGQYYNLHIPTMIEYLNTCVIYNCVPVIEIKKIQNYEGFLQTVYDSGLQDRCIITGGIEDLVKVRELNNTIPLMVIGYSNQEYTFYLDLISQLDGNRGILYNFPVVTEEVVKELHNQGIYCGVWSLDTAEEAQQFMNYGVDYVVTNEIPAINQMINDKE